ncbi:MAG TPA: carboxyl transferase domain-containing protein [Dehalococcoidia bacterium]|nr:carboxyl transferase domain-containing protein [Dehalococcoidia bacterium]
MPFSKLLVANRGEIAVRILRAAAALGIATVAVYSEDDAQALHVRRADEAVPLRGVGATAYLDIAQLVAAARERGCDAIHPGYGFLSEQAAFARACAQADITFVGPDAETLATFGDKPRARALAAQLGVPVPRGSAEPVSLQECRAFFAALGGGAIVIKAVAGGGGRGMRVVAAADEIEQAYERCRSEAQAAFGDGLVYVEQFLPNARHVEVQIAGDGSGAVSHLWERECSLQRRHQKLVEVASCPALSPALRAALTADAVRLAEAVCYRGLGTFEFLVNETAGAEPAYAFIEANARLQVEHTVTEEVLHLDLVQAQLQIAGGASLAELGLEQGSVPAPQGHAVQVRINLETVGADGAVRPSAGTLTVFEPPSGPGIRVDSYGYSGYRTNPNFDSLLAKLICWSPSPRFADAITATYRALCEFRIEGVQTNIPFLQNLLRHPDVASDSVSTRFLDEHAAELAAPSDAHPKRFFEAAPAAAGRAGARISAADPLAVLNYGRAEDAVPPPPPDAFDFFGERDGISAEGTITVRAPMQATIVSVDVQAGDAVRRGQQLLVLNAMKMEHVIQAPAPGTVRAVAVAPGDTLYEGEPLLYLDAREAEADEDDADAQRDLDAIRPDLAEVLRRRWITTSDPTRLEAIAKRHARGGRTAQENVDDLCDPGSFTPYGRLAVGMALRGTTDELLAYAPADGMVMGLGHVNSDQFDETKSRCVVLAYDYTVLAGTQGGMNHKMQDRMLDVAAHLRAPVVYFTEGGGGRAGGGSRNAAGQGSSSERAGGGGGLATPTWNKLGRLSGLVPIIGVNAGRCFAGNAALLGCCDVIIATANSNIGMGGPAMIEGGGLGVFRPEEIGPMSVQVPNGVVDIAVRDEAEAVQAAKKYLSYFQGPLKQWECADQRLMRGLIPENRLRIYDVRNVIETLADTGSVLELRRGFGLAMITALIRVEGRPVGIVANNPAHLSGAIDSAAADKAARFMTICDAFDIPLLFLCDTPGIMVGPEAEKEATVRHSARMFVVGASVTVPFFTIILRKSYGLGAQTMGAGNHKLPLFTIAWPTAEFGGMGLEGQVKLGRRRELEAIADPAERQAAFERMVETAYERGRALNAAHVFEVEDVIDPAESRAWLLAGLKAAPPVLPRDHKKRPCIDPW